MNDDIRRDQINHGRSTLGVKQGYDNRDGQRRTQFGPKPARKPHVPKGHDAILAELQERGCPVTFIVAGQETTGVVIGRDKFTIVVRPVLQTAPPIKSLVLYKHAIDCFTVPVDELAA